MVQFMFRCGQLLFHQIAVVSVTLATFFVLETTAYAAVVPTIDSLTIAGPSSYGTAATSISLTENSTTTVYIWGRATDNDTCEQIDAVSNYLGKFYRSDRTQNCTADNNDCYTVGAWTVDECTAGGQDFQARYQGSVNLQYYADPTDAGSPNSGFNWVAFIRVTDDTSTSAEQTNSTEVESLIALDTTSSVDYGTVVLGGISNEQLVTITNTGNRAIDAVVSANQDLSCTIGSVLAGNIKYSLTGGFTYDTQGTAITVAPTTTNVNNSTAQRTNDASPIQTNLYLRVRMPEQGTAGTCTNTLTFTAQADA